MRRQLPMRPEIKALRWIVVCLILLSASVAAQKGDEPIVQEPNWQRYRLTPHKLSVLLPKMPVSDDSRDECRSYSSNVYSSFADDIVYTVRVFADTKRRPPSWCRETSKFDAAFMDERIRDLESSLKLRRTLDEKSGTYRKVLLADDLHQYQIVGDPAKGGFFVYSVAHHKDHIVDTNRFFNSLETSTAKTESVLDVLKGSHRTVGDSKLKPIDKESWREIDTETLDRNYRIVNKFKARYTDAARTANIQGTVRLRVTLLASGATGAITPVTKLPHGLTEQAITAAKRIVFLPKKVKGVNQNVIVTVEYGFNIY